MRSVLQVQYSASTGYPIKKEQAKNGEHADDADGDVNDDIETKKVWHAITYSDLSQKDIDSVVPSGLYVKYKNNPVDNA